MNGKSMDIVAENLNRLKELFPEVIKEGKVDFDLLKGLLGVSIQSEGERYGLYWAGKSEAFKEIQRQTTSTLVPDREGSVEFDTSENLFIEGDNLEVLRVLQRSYYGKVKMIYIDPPYNTGNDFIYNDKFAQNRKEYLKEIGAIDDDGNVINAELYRKNVKDNGHFHSKWLSMMYPRLFLARNLLREDGVIFVSIDDNEVANLKLLMDMVFGEENFISMFIWKSRQIVDSRSSIGVSNDHEYVLSYSKSNESVLRGKNIDLSKYKNPDSDERGPWMSNSILGLANASERPNLHYSIINPETGIEYNCPQATGWRYSKETMESKINDGRIIFPVKDNGRPREKKFLSELNNEHTNISSIVKEDVGYTLNGTRELRELIGDSLFPFPKPYQLVSFFIDQVATQNEDIVLDFFAGSGTTAQAVMSLNFNDGLKRKYIIVQLPETTKDNSEATKAGFKNIADISKERIRRVIKKIKQEMNGSLEFNDLDLGFKSFKLQESNFKIWDGNINENEIANQLEAYIDITKPESTVEGMLYELILKSGLSLTATIKQVETAFIVDDKYAFVLSETTDEQFKSLLSKNLLRITVLEQALGSDDNRITSNQLLFEDKKIEFQII